MNTIPPDTIDHRLRTPAKFDSSMEQLGQGDIYVINPDEYTELIGLSHESARELPDGLYVVDETIRDRLNAAGMDYGALSRAVISGIRGSANLAEIGDQLKLGRQNSKHKVFFGSLQIQGAGNGDNTSNVLMAIKPHYEHGSLSAKPYKELGNLALLQSLGLEGIYKPIGVLQSGDLKFVLTELRPGIRTLDEHQWLGKRALRQARGKLTPGELADIHERDVALVGKFFELLGTLHAQGIFHGDAQMKNIGWTPLRLDASKEKDTNQPMLHAVRDLAGIEMTIVDLENAILFARQNGDFSREYYDQLLELASKDLTQFLGSITKKVRVSLASWRGQQNDDAEFVAEHFIAPYISAFTRQRMTLFNGEKPSGELIEALTNHVTQKIHELNGPRKQAPKRTTRFKKPGPALV